MQRTTNPSGVMLGVRVTVAPNALEAETVCGFLRTDGIECEHRQTNLGAGATEATGDAGPREILVPADQLARAQELLDSIAEAPR